MTNATYVRYELIRALRNRRFFVFSLVFPLILFLLVAGPNRHEKLADVPFAVYYLGGMVAWGTMAAVIGAGARISAERSLGWHRQLRVTPLGPVPYVGAKVLTGYVVAAASIATLDAASMSLDVRLPLTRWLVMTGLVLVGLIPFAVFGIFIGHMLTPESIGPVMGGVTSLFALLGGAYGPFASSGFLHDLVTLLPSYWLVQAGKVAYTGGAWPARAWIVLAVWALVMTRLAMRAWRRDTARA